MLGHADNMHSIIATQKKVNITNVCGCNAQLSHIPIHLLPITTKVKKRESPIHINHCKC